MKEYHFSSPAEEGHSCDNHKQPDQDGKESPYPSDDPADDAGEGLLTLDDLQSADEEKQRAESDESYPILPIVYMTRCQQNVIHHVRVSF